MEQKGARRRLIRSTVSRLHQTLVVLADQWLTMRMGPCKEAQQRKSVGPVGWHRLTCIVWLSP